MHCDVIRGRNRKAPKIFTSEWREQQGDHTPVPKAQNQLMNTKSSWVHTPTNWGREKLGPSNPGHGLRTVITLMSSDLGERKSIRMSRWETENVKENQVFEFFSKDCGP